MLSDISRLQPGDRICGKWSGGEYRVERKLGEGANGSVYLARSSSGSSLCALKIGLDLYGLQSEMNALRILSGSIGDQSGRSIPTVYEAEDWEYMGIVYPFYTMPYVAGVPISFYARTHGTKALLRCGAKLLRSLRALHKSGWAFGDLKGDNVLVSADGEPALIDFGGAARFGCSVKQYSEMYDRGFWRAGGRTAEATYDLFAFAVLIVEAAGESSRLTACMKRVERRDQFGLLTLIDGCSGLRPVAHCLKKMIRGEYARAEDALSEWEQASNVWMPIGRQPHAASWLIFWLAGSAVTFAASLWWVVQK